MVHAEAPRRRRAGTCSRRRLAGCVECVSRSPRTQELPGWQESIWRWPEAIERFEQGRDVTRSVLREDPLGCAGQQGGSCQIQGDYDKRWWSRLIQQ